MNGEHKRMQKWLYPLFFLLAGLAGAAEKTLIMAYDADPVSMDPHEQLSGGTLQLSHMIFDPLVRWTRDRHFEGRLAEKWERLDARTMRFHLRKGVTFHSGHPFTATDVKYTFDRLKRSPDFKALFEPVSVCRIVDDHTVELVTAKPYPLLLQMVTYLFPLDHRFYAGKDELKKHGDSFASRNASGTGPFTVSERQQGVKVVFDRFPKYWDTRSPGNVGKIILTPIKEGPTRVAALLSGDVDFIAPVPPNDHARIKRDPKLNLVTMSGTRVITLQLNQKRRPEFRRVQVRQAIVYAINNDGIVKKIMRGFATTAAQQSPRGYAGHHPGLTPRYDVKKAQALMKEAGYAKGFSCTMIAPNNRYVNDYKIAQAVVSMLAKIKIKVTLKTMPKAQYWPEFDKRSADIQLLGWHSDTEDSANFTEFLCMTPNADTGYGQYNSGNYSSPRVDALIMASRTETDTGKRAALLQEVEKILYDDAAFVPLHWQDLAWAAHKAIDIAPILNVMNVPYLGDLVIRR
jgi:peptide/nickel transport system substrate-binding protein